MSKRKVAGFCGGVAAACSLWALHALGLEVKSVDFKVEDGKSKITISGDGALTFANSSNAENNQIIIDLPGATLSTAASRPLDTSSFDSPVKLVSPYPESEGGSGARILIQLSKEATPTVSSIENGVEVVFDGTGAPATADAGMDLPNPDSGMTSTDAGVTDSAPTPVVDQSTLQEFEASQKTQQFTGKAVTLQVRDAPVREVLRMIGDASGFNLVVAPDVQGNITLALEEVPWDQVLAVVLKTLQLGAERDGNVLRILTLQNLTRERQAEVAARQAADAAAPKITRVFPISYARPSELISILTAFSSATGGGADDAGPGGGSASSFQVDQRTNSIVVQARPEVIERAQKLIEILDTETPQVVIEAKIVEASEGFTSAISGSLGAGGSAFGASFDGGNNITSGLVGSLDLSTASAGGGSLGLSPTISFLPGISRVNALLTMTERQSLAKVISSPRLVVLNNVSAAITQTIPSERVVVVTTATSTTQTTQQVDAVLSLNVTPQVTNNEKVMLNLNLNRDVNQGGTADPLIAHRTMNTQVLVDSGSTLVIGGVYSLDNTKNDSGFPVLKDIPILGALFGDKSDITRRTELFIFISPRILNTNEAGLSG